MNKPKLAVIYQGQRDSHGRIMQTRLWLEHDGARASGTVLRGQVFNTQPYDARESPFDVRHFFLAIQHGIGGTPVPQSGEKEARAWLLEGVTLTPTCRRCGMGEDRHTTSQHAHKFEACA